MKTINHHQIRTDLKYNDVVLYLKGTAALPMCGFSAAAVQILSQLDVHFKAINILEDREIHDGIKALSNWPTIPQLFIKGEFVGGCETLRDMFQRGELQELLQQKGVGLKKAPMESSICRH